MALDSYLLQNKDPLQSYLEGAQGIQTLQNNNQVMQARRDAQMAAQQQAEQAQAAALQKQQAQLAMYNAKTSQERANLTAQYMTAYPDDYKAVGDASKQMSDAQRSSLQGLVSKVTSSVGSNNIPLGQQTLDEYVTGLQNSGAPDDQIASAKFYQQLYKSDPKAAISGLNLAARALDPSSYDANNKVGVETQNAVSEEARKAQAQPLENAKTTAQTVQIYSDIDMKREENRLKAMQAARDKELDPLKRQQLQLDIDTKTQDLAAKKAEKVAAGETASASFDNTIQTLNNVMTHKGLSASVGKSSLLPTIPGSDSADFQAILDTLKSQQFLSSVSAMKGSGALSDAEGAKLTNAISNLDLRQSEGAFRKNLQTAMDIVTAAKARSAKQYAAPPMIFDPRKTSYGAFMGGK